MIKMINKTNLTGGVALIMGGLGEMIATQSVCPLCIGAIGGGSAMIADSFGIKLNR